MCFSILPTPLDLAKIGITFISEKSGIKARRPKLVFIGSSDYLDQHFLEEAKIYANKRGIGRSTRCHIHRPFTCQRNPALRIEGPNRSSSILSSIKQANPDFAYLSLNSKEASSIIRGSQENGTEDEMDLQFESL